MMLVHDQHALQGEREGDPPLFPIASTEHGFFAVMWPAERPIPQEKPSSLRRQRRAQS